MKQLTTLLTIWLGISINLMNGQILERYEHALNHEPHQHYPLTGHHYDYGDKENYGRRLQQTQALQQLAQQYEPTQPHHRHHNLQSQSQQQHQHQHQQQHQNNQMMPSEKSNKIIINDVIKETFNVSSQPGLHLFSPPIYTGANLGHSHGAHHGSHAFHTHNSSRKGPFEVNAHDCLEQGKTFCNKVRNYPDLSRLDDILRIHYPDLAKYVGEDALVVQNISQRMNIEPDEEFLCRSKEKVYYPEAAQNKEANWFFIVNNSNFKQGVRVEECEGVEAKCSALISLPSGYYATCKQNYIYRSLIALTPDAKLFSDQFKLPSCCKCVIKQKKN